MRSTPRLVLLILLFVFLCFESNAQWLKKSESSDDLYREAKKEIDLKHYQRAINLCHAAIDVSPTNLDIHLLLGRAYGLAGKVDSARIELNYVIQKNPKYKDAYIYLVNIEAVACNYQQALEYADMGLKYYPGDRDLLLKKLDIYTKTGDYLESSKLADYLFERYSSDAYIRSVYLEYKLTLARQYSHKGYLEMAKRAYEAVLEQDPLNKEALQAVFSLDVRSGNYESSLAFTNRALQSSPNSYEFLLKKVSILDAMSRYIEAIEVIEKLMKLYPSNTEVQKLNIYLRMEAGKYYMNADPYLQFQAVLEKDPTNHDALGDVINVAYSRGLMTFALYWVNIALSHYPNDHDWMLKKMGILEALKMYNVAAPIAEGIYKNNPTPANRHRFLDYKILSAKQYMNENEFDSAAIALNAVLFYDHANLIAINYLINTYTQQKRYDDVLHVIDEALTYYPGDEQLLFRKSAILEAYQRYTEAAFISRQLLTRYPSSKQYLIAFVEQSLLASKQTMQYDDYFGTIDILHQVLDLQPENLDALLYMINIQAAYKQFDSATYYCDEALRYHPDNKDLLLKKSQVLNDGGHFSEACEISGALYGDYPYNLIYRNTYVYQLCTAGQHEMVMHQTDSALNYFSTALSIAPNDTLTLYYTINALLVNNQTDSALALIAKGRFLYPNNTYFLLKRAQIYEGQKRWNDAWLSMDTLLRITPYDLKMIDYAESLYSHRLKNEIGFLYLHSKIVDTATTAINSVASVQYTRRFNRGSFTGRVNYAGRPIGTGFQFEAETYLNIVPKWFVFAAAGYSPDGAIFPTQRYALSFFHSFKKGWEAELGGRFLTADSGSINSGIASISKEIKDFYFNLRGSYGYFTNSINQVNTYGSGVLTTRIIVSPHGDYFTNVLGYGTAPDDFSRNYEITRILLYNTVSAGAGFTKNFHYRTTLTLFGTWYNTQVGIKHNLNQYDIYVSLLRRF